ncbi:MAG: hypothetical protein AAF481_14480 [Acidobacteriota bacterium]
MYKLLLAALMFLACQPSITGGCSNTVIAESKSPDGQYSATFFERDCGATTDYSSLISLRESNKDFDTEDVEIVVAIDGRSDIQMQWTSRRSLWIDPGDSEVVRHNGRWRDVQVSVKEQ